MQQGEQPVESKKCLIVHDQMMAQQADRPERVPAQQVREQETFRARATAGFRAVAWSFEEHRRFWSGAAGLACALWFAIGWFRRTDMSFLFGRLGRELGGDVATGVLVVASIVIHGLVRRIVLRVFDLFRPRRLR